MVSDGVVAGEWWWRAAELGAAGRYRDADACLHLLPPRSPWDSLATSMRASHRRQVGAPARDLDERAVALASTDESLADALVGLAADAVAEGNAADARAPLDQAREPSLTTWRTACRWHWVSAELALLQGRAEHAAALAREAADVSESHSQRHWAKSMIIAMAAGDSRACARAEPVADLLPERGLVTLQWPLALVLADREETDAVLCQRMWFDARRAVNLIEEQLPDDMRPWWNAHRGVRRIHGR